MDGSSGGEAVVETAYRRLYDSFVEPFDAHDNGIAAYPEEIVPRYHRPWDIFAQVNILNPAWNEHSVNPDERFLQAVALVKTNFEAVLGSVLNSWLPGRAIVERCFLNVPNTLLDKTVSDDRILILDQFCPWIVSLAPARPLTNLRRTTSLSWRGSTKTPGPSSTPSTRTLQSDRGNTPPRPIPFTG